MVQKVLRVVAMVVAVLLTACGGDGDAEMTADLDELEARVATVVELLEEDGFAPGEDDDEDDDLEFESAECREVQDVFGGGDLDMPGEAADAETGPFERESGEISLETVEAGVAVFEDTEGLEEAIDLVTSDLFGECLAEAFRLGAEEDAQPGIELGELEVSSVERAAGEEGGGVRVAGEISADGFSIGLELEAQLVRTGDVAAFYVGALVGEVEDPVDPARYLDVLLDGSD